MVIHEQPGRDLYRTQQALGHVNIGSTILYLPMAEDEIQQAIISVVYPFGTPGQGSLYARHLKGDMGTTPWSESQPLHTVMLYTLEAHMISYDIICAFSMLPRGI